VLSPATPATSISPGHGHQKYRHGDHRRARGQRGRGDKAWAGAELPDEVGRRDAQTTVLIGQPVIELGPGSTPDRYYPVTKTHHLFSCYKPIKRPRRLNNFALSDQGGSPELPAF
jgi:hypothetical protein